MSNVMYMQLHSQHVKMTIECQIFSWKALGYARVFHDTEKILQNFQRKQIFFFFFFLLSFFFFFFFSFFFLLRNFRNTENTIKQHKNKAVKFVHALKIWLKPASVAMFLQFITALSYVLYMSPKIMEFEV